MTLSGLYVDLKPQDRVVCRALLRHGRRIVLRRGEMAFRQGDIASHVFHVARGGLLLYRDGMDDDIGVDLVSTHALCGLNEFLGKRPFAVHARATTETVLLRLPAGEFATAMAMSAAFAELVLRAVARDAADSTTRLEWLVGARLDERLRRLFTDLAHRRTGNRRRNLHLSQGDIATLLGASRQRVNAALQRLEHEPQRPCKAAERVLSRR